MIYSHKDLDVWKKSMDLVDEMYKVTRAFPQDERYGLSSQIRRSAVSIPSNIAEGSGRNGRKEYSQYINIARGSLSELETQIMIAYRQDFIQEDAYRRLLTSMEDIGKMLSRLYSRLNETAKGTVQTAVPSYE